MIYWHFAEFHASVLCWPCLRQHGLLAADQPAMQATRQSTLCASHCPTPGMCWRRRVHTGSVTLLHSSIWPFRALMLAQLFLHTILFQVCQLCKVSGDHASSGTIKSPDTEVQPHLKPMNRPACVQWVNTHFPYVLPSEGRAEVKSDAKSRGKGEGDISEWRKPLCVSGMQPSGASAKEESHWSSSQRDWKNY